MAKSRIIDVLSEGVAGQVKLRLESGEEIESPIIYERYESFDGFKKTILKSIGDTRPKCCLNLSEYRIYRSKAVCTLETDSEDASKLKLQAEMLEGYVLCLCGKHLSRTLREQSVREDVFLEIVILLPEQLWNTAKETQNNR